MGNITITEIKLINCQSWSENSESIKFTPGLNCIRADNNTGKSVIMKVLLAIVGQLNRKELKEIIRDGCEYAQALIAFSDGSAGVVQIRPTKVIYMYTENMFVGDGGLVNYGEVMPQPFKDRLSILSSENNEYVVNLMDDERPLFLVNSDKRYNYNLLRILTEDTTLETLIEICKNKIVGLDRLKLDCESKLHSLEYRLGTVEYKDSTKMEWTVDFMERYLGYFDTCATLSEVSEKFLPTRTLPIKLEKLITMSDVLEDLERLDENFQEDLKEIPKGSEQVLNCIEELPEIGEGKYIPNAYEVINDIIETLPEIKENTKEIKDYYNIINDFLTEIPNVDEDTKEIKDSYIKINEFLTDIPNVEDRINPKLLGYLGDITEILELNKDIKMYEYKKHKRFYNTVATVLKMNNEFVGIFNSLSEIQKSESKIKELESIDLNGTEYECPLYGKILYNDNKCEPMT